jgi:hypothetical protein
MTPERSPLTVVRVAVQVDLAAAAQKTATGWAIVTSLLTISALGLVLVTAGARHPLYPTAVTFIFFACIFPVHFRTVIVGGRVKRETGTSVAEPANPWPPPFSKRLGYAVCAAYAAALVLVALSVPTVWGGQPERHGNRYYLDNHGQLTLVSEAKYYAGEIGVDRWFLTRAAVFLGVGAVFNLRLARPRE